jgi:hypothetical protein
MLPNSKGLWAIESTWKKETDASYSHERTDLSISLHHVILHDQKNASKCLERTIGKQLAFV